MHAIRWILVLAVTWGCRPQSDGAPASADVDTLRIDGSAGVLPLVSALANAYKATNPRSVIQLRSGLGNRARVPAVAAGEIDIAMSSMAVDSSELRRSAVAAHEIANAAVVFGVHGSVDATNLSDEQVCRIYRGAVTDWRQLGGRALTVQPRSRPVGEVDLDVALARFACLGEATRSVAILEGPEDMAAALASTPGAIGMTSLPFVERSGGKVRALTLNGVAPTAPNVRRGVYPLRRRSILLARADAPDRVRRFLAFTRGAEGARVIAANGAVPIQ